MKNLIPRNQSGKSIMELMIVLTVVIILVTIAVAQFGTAGTNLDRQNIAREFKVSLERARFDSVKRRAANCDDMSRVVITSASSFTLLTDMNQNSTIETASEARVVDFEDRSDVRIVGQSTDFPITIRFDQRGNVSTGPCSAPVNVAEKVVFCNTPCTMAMAGASNSNIIFVSPTGTATMAYGGSSLPTFANPTVTNVDVNSAVNPLLAVWDPDAVASPSPSVDPSASPSVLPTVDPSTPTPTATPTPTPTPTPTATPTPTPSATPTATPTPTPTATPLACAYGDKPSQTGCTCYAPMWVRTNGKCQ
jgi:Tfp pilus assembly protein FimT